MTEACKICNNTEQNSLHQAREMAFGLREKFTYLECGSCGCVQLLDIPKDMSKYYPPNYYSFAKHGALKTALRHRWSAHAFGRKNLFGYLAAELFFPNRAVEAVRRAALPSSAAILDVGCGSGRLLLDLAYLGYTNLTGVDPFNPRELVYKNGVKVYKRELADFQGQFDLVMLHFCYEHMDRPAEVMRHIRRLLLPGGQAVVRIPLASSYAWRRYGTNWVNMDPPRHFYLHTFKSIDILAEQTGLQVKEVIHEGFDDQFWGSEQFERDIPSQDPRSLYSRPVKRLLAWKMVRQCKAKAEKLNREGQGDLVCFHLVRTPSARNPEKGGQEPPLTDDR